MKACLGLAHALLASLELFPMIEERWLDALHAPTESGLSEVMATFALLKSVLPDTLVTQVRVRALRDSSVPLRTRRVSQLGVHLVLPGRGQWSVKARPVLAYRAPVVRTPELLGLAPALRDFLGL